MAAYLPSDARSTALNLPASVLQASVEGPARPDGRTAGDAPKNHRGGHVEDAFLTRMEFDAQYNAAEGRGEASRRESGRRGGGAGGPEGAGGSVRSSGSGTASPSPPAVSLPPPKRAKRVPGPPGSGLRPGEEMPYFRLTSRQPWANVATNTTGAAAVAALEGQAKAGKEGEQSAPSPPVSSLPVAAPVAPIASSASSPSASSRGAKAPKGPRSVFHGSALVDYQGRAWCAPPASGRASAPERSFAPKREAASWAAHAKGVNAVRYAPKTGHLLATAGLEGKAKIWSVSSSSSSSPGKLLRSYEGHAKGVRDVRFSPDGRRLLTTGYDKVMRLWDVETGTVLASLGEGTMTFAIAFHPTEEETIMAGRGDKKICQYDWRSGDVVQEYDYHLGPVNTVTFYDDGRRFASTSDDKTIRLWEYGIPVQVKAVADPAMHAISAATLTNGGGFWLGQSQDNAIVTYLAGERFKLNRKKRFAGHLSAGYACDVAVAPDDGHVASGDGEGKLFVWDWKTARIVKSFKAHQGPVPGIAWSPIQTSRIATGGWDGIVKLWD